MFATEAKEHLKILLADPEVPTVKCYKRFYTIRSVLHGSLGIAPGGLGFPET